jgi:hypothetical protein
VPFDKTACVVMQVMNEELTLGSGFDATCMLYLLAFGTNPHGFG